MSEQRSGFFAELRDHLDMDPASLHTFWKIVVRPTHVLRAFLAGERQGLIGPIKLTFALLAVVLLADAIIPDAYSLSEMIQDEPAAFASLPLLLDHEQFDEEMYMDQLNSYISTGLYVVWFAGILTLALAQRLFFRRWTLIQHFGAAAYLLGVFSILNIVGLVTQRWTPPSWQFAIVMLPFLVVLFIVYLRVFARRIGDDGEETSAPVLGVFGAITGSLLFVLVYVVTTVLFFGIGIALAEDKVLPGQAAPGRNADVFLVRMEASDNRLRFGRPQNITERGGFEGHPVFSADGHTLYYESGITGRAPFDEAPPPPVSVMAWNVNLGGEEQVAEVGSQPRLAPDGVTLSYMSADGIVVGDVETRIEGTLDVMALAEGRALVVREDSDVDVDDPAYRTLHLREADGSEQAIALPGLITGLVRDPGGGVLLNLYVDESDDEHALYRINFATLAVSKVFDDPRDGGRGEPAWLPDGRLLLGDDTRILVRDEAGDWATLVEFSEYRLRGISDLAVSPDGQWLAFQRNRPDVTHLLGGR
jgi:WD40 repeat protein